MLVLAHFSIVSATDCTEKLRLFGLKRGFFCLCVIHEIFVLLFHECRLQKMWQKLEIRSYLTVDFPQNPYFEGKSMETEAITWKEFPSEWEAIAKQTLRVKFSNYSQETTLEI